MLDFDEENARRLEAIYTTPDIVDQRRAIRRRRDRRMQQTRELTGDRRTP